MLKFKYDTKKYNFAEKIKSIFSVQFLDEINESFFIFTRENDQNTIWHKLYYEWTKTIEFTNLYSEFIEEIIKPIYKNEMVVYQAIPNLRVAYPNNIAVGEWHKDKWYRDVNWAESVKEDNFFLPLTNAYDTNTIWVESVEDKGDFYPLNCNYGEIIKWDGSNLTHGNKINKTNKTRVSVDFRIIQYSNYKPSEFGSINTKTKFKIGNYYKLI